MQHISREGARLAGLTRFFVGFECKRGHVAEQYVANNKCVVCQRDEMRERYWENPELRRAKAKEWVSVPENRAKRSKYQKGYKKANPTGKFTLKRRERDTGRPRPDICDLCSKPNTINKPIYFDHCHRTGQFRGWLCHRCNTVLGAVQDDAELLLRMSNYVNKVEANNGSPQNPSQSEAGQADETGIAA